MSACDKEAGHETTHRFIAIYSPPQRGVPVHPWIRLALIHTVADDDEIFFQEDKLQWLSLSLFPSLSLSLSLSLCTNSYTLTHTYVHVVFLSPTPTSGDAIKFRCDSDS